MKASLLLTGLLLAACDSVPHFSEEAVNATNLGAALPKGFLFGAATAAHQVEGGLHNDWTAWEHDPLPDGGSRIFQGATSDVSAGSWTRWPDDVSALQQLGANAYRFSIEWSRLEPEDGVWDVAAEANYRAQLLALKARGITPLVTIHHYTFPLWVSRKGGFEWSEPGRNVADALAAYAGRLGEKFGDLVDFWCTINEPNYGTFESYLFGGYPPGAQDMVRLGNAYSMTMKAHAKMAAALRARDTVDADGDGHATRIGVALNVNIFEPTSTTPLDVAMAGLVDDAYNEMVPRAAATGRIKLAFPGTLDLDEEVPGLKGSFDYLGINYYSRFYVRFDLTDGSFSRQYYMPGRDQSDIGFENYAEGFYRLLLRMNRWGWPIYVLENGVADASGTRRPQYLRNHLYALIQARAQGADVRGYFQWSLVDVFEWTFGYGGKLGLFRVDQSDPTLTRQRTPAVDTFRQIAEEGGLVPP